MYHKILLHNLIKVECKVVICFCLKSQFNNMLLTEMACGVKWFVMTRDYTCTQNSAKSLSGHELYLVFKAVSGN